MLLRLSRLSSSLAVIAAALAFVGPADSRGLAADIGLALGAVAFMLWRGALLLRQRSEQAADAVPAALPLDGAALSEVAGLVTRAAVEAPSMALALHGVADALRSELGARAVQVFAIARSEGGAPSLDQLIAAQPGFRLPRRDVMSRRRDDPTLRAWRERCVCLNLPDALAVPVVVDVEVVALLELTDLAIDFDETELRRVLELAAARLAERGDAGDLNAWRPMAGHESLPVALQADAASTGRMERTASSRMERTASNFTTASITAPRYMLDAGAWA